MERGLMDDIGEYASDVGQGLMGAGGMLGEFLIAAKAPAMYKNMMAERQNEEALQQQRQWARGIPNMTGANLASGDLSMEQAQAMQKANPSMSVYKPGATATEMAKYMATSPHASFRDAGAGLISQGYAPEQQPVNPYSNIVRGARGNAFGIDQQGQQVQLPGTAVPQRQQRPMVQNIVNTGQPQMESLADKETYKLTGQYRGKRLNNFSNLINTTNSVVSSITDTRSMLRKLRDSTGHTTTGVGSMLKGIPTTDAKDWLEMKEVIQSRLAMDKIAELKSMSHTGSTGLGPMSDRDLSLLQKQLGSLDESQSPTAIKANIDQIIKLLDKSERGFNTFKSDEIKWRNRNKLPNMLDYKEESGSIDWADL